MEESISSKDGVPMAVGKDLQDIDRKEKTLERILAGTGGVLVAFSGGVDSTFLLYKAIQVLGKEKVLAVTAASELYPAEDTEDARAIALQLAARHLVIHTEELSNDDFCSNPPERCYHCKKELFGRLLNLAREHSLPAVVDGANLDDTADYRPGSRAARELGVCSPLQEADLSKEEIRGLSRRCGLQTWEKPAAACLASRFPYGERLEPGKIRQVGQAERFLRRLGLRRAVRVRCHGTLARIEVSPLESALILENKGPVVDYFKQIGFLYVTLDLEGFLSGSMNRTLDSRA